MVSRRAGDPRVVLARALVYLALLAVVAVSLFPIYFALTTSLKRSDSKRWTVPTADSRNVTSFEVTRVSAICFP